MQGPVNGGATRDFHDKIIPSAENFLTGPDHFIGMGNMGQVIDGKHQYLGEPVPGRFMLVRILFKSCDDFACAVRGSDFGFYFSGAEFPFIFKIVKGFCAGCHIDLSHQLALFQESAVNVNVGFDFNGFIIHQESVQNRLFRAVGKDFVLKQGQGMGGGCGREPDFDGIKIVQDIFPSPGFLC